jgi:hypothetical protein
MNFILNCHYFLQDTNMQSKNARITWSWRAGCENVFLLGISLSTSYLTTDDESILTNWLIIWCFWVLTFWCSSNSSSTTAGYWLSEIWQLQWCWQECNGEVNKNDTLNCAVIDVISHGCCRYTKMSNAMKAYGKSIFFSLCEWWVSS